MKNALLLMVFLMPSLSLAFNVNHYTNDLGDGITQYVFELTEFDFSEIPGWIDDSFVCFSMYNATLDQSIYSFWPDAHYISEGATITFNNDDLPEGDYTALNVHTQALEGSLCSAENVNQGLLELYSGSPIFTGQH